MLFLSLFCWCARIVLQNQRHVPGWIAKVSLGREWKKISSEISHKKHLRDEQRPSTEQDWTFPFPFPSLKKNFVRLFSLTKAESYTFHHCRRRRLRSLFTLECRGYSNYQVIKLLKHLYRICVVTTKVRVPPQQHQISSQFSKELTETKLREEKFSIHVRFRVSDDGIEWLMMLQEKRRKLRCDVKVIKAEEWRTNKSTFEIENVEEKNLHTKFLMNKARDGCRKMCFDDDGK